MDKFNTLNSKKIPWFTLTFAMLGSTLVLFVVAPLIKLILATSFSELSETAIDKEVLASIRTTITAAFFAVAVSSISGIPLAYFLARKRFPGRSILLAIIDLPIIIPHAAAGIALLTVIGRKSLIGKVFGDSLVGTTAGISVAMAFVSLPFLVNTAMLAFSAVPVKHENAARTLGAGPWRTFFTISLPMARRGVISGMILMWARGISEFGAVVIIAYHPMTVPVMVYQRFNDYGLDYARSVAVLLIIVCVTIFVTLRILNRSDHQEITNA